MSRLKGPRGKTQPPLPVWRSLPQRLRRGESDRINRPPDSRNACPNGVAEDPPTEKLPAEVDSKIILTLIFPKFITCRTWTGANEVLSPRIDSSKGASRPFVRGTLLPLDENVCRLHIGISAPEARARWGSVRQSVRFGGSGRVRPPITLELLTIPAIVRGRVSLRGKHCRATRCLWRDLVDVGIRNGGPWTLGGFYPHRRKMVAGEWQTEMGRN